MKIHASRSVAQGRRTKLQSGEERGRINGLDDDMVPPWREYG